MHQLPGIFLTNLPGKVYGKHGGRNFFQSWGGTRASKKAIENVCGLNWQLRSHKHWKMSSLTFVSMFKEFYAMFCKPSTTLIYTRCYLFTLHWHEHVTVTSCSCYLCHLNLFRQNSKLKSGGLGPCGLHGSATCDGKFFPCQWRHHVHSNVVLQPFCKIGKMEANYGNDIFGIMLRLAWLRPWCHGSCVVLCQYLTIITRYSRYTFCFFTKYTKPY